MGIVRRPWVRRAVAGCLAAVVGAGCGRNPYAPVLDHNYLVNDDANPDLVSETGPQSFTVTPVALADVGSVIPLGNLNPPEHVFPTDHAYFAFANYQQQNQTVFAPGGGVVTNIRAVGSAQKMTVQMSKTFLYYLDHITVSAGLAAGTRLTAGQIIGTHASDGSAAVDLGVINDEAVNPRLVNAYRYHYSTIHADSPLKFFAEPVKSQVYAKVTRSGSDKDGRVDYDIAGQLAGGWFSEDSPFDASGERQGIFFGYDVMDPSQVRISLGESLAASGWYGIPASGGDPASVSPASGKVAYRLYKAMGGSSSVESSQSGLLIVQMLDGTHMKAEAFSGSSASTAEFTSGAKIFIR